MTRVDRVNLPKDVIVAFGLISAAGIYALAFAMGNSHEMALWYISNWALIALCAFFVVAAGICKYAWYKFLIEGDMIGMVVLHVMAVFSFTMGIGLGASVIRLLSCSYC